MYNNGSSIKLVINLFDQHKHPRPNITQEFAKEFLSDMHRFIDRLREEYFVKNDDDDYDSDPIDMLIDTGWFSMIIAHDEIPSITGGAY